MALKLSVTKQVKFVGDVTLNCIAKIHSITTGPTAVLCLVEWRTEDSNEHVQMQEFEVPVNDFKCELNIYECCYNHLKTLPEFSGAVDI